MSPEHRSPKVKPSILPQRESHFSWLRTRLSIERTLMSWIRTATAMIGFGFTIFQFFERFKQQDATQPIAMVPSRIISIGLITAGTLALFIAVREYRRTLRYLWSEDFRDIAGMEAKPSFTPALSVAMLLTLVGVVTLVAVVAQLIATTT
jgi:putative membrane protein